MITTYKELEELIENLSPQDFEVFIHDIIASLEVIESVQLDVRTQYSQFDIVALEKQSWSIGKPSKWIVEVKKYRSPIQAGLIEQFYAKSLGFGEPNLKLFFVSPSGYTMAAATIADKFGIMLWSLKEILTNISDSIAQKYFRQKVDKKSVQAKREIQKSKEENLITSLKEINAGDIEWPQYQRAVFDILENLFCPPLDAPYYELADIDSRNRRDIIFENSSESGFWKIIRENYLGNYIVVDAKNYKNELSKRPILDISHYLKEYGCGMFGIIVCRKGAGGAAKHAIKEQWIGGRKLIVVLSDADIQEMFELKQEGGKPEEVIRKQIAEFRMTL